MSTPVWNVVNVKSGFTRQVELCLSWEVNCDPISDDYVPDETSARNCGRCGSASTRSRSRAFTGR
jgi:hypothetical protein